MQKIGLRDLDILDIGNTIQIAGALWQDEKTTYLVLLPNETIDNTELVVLPMDVPEWERFIRQTDILETEILRDDGTGIIKQLVRKSQRQIDNRVQWTVFKRDGYRCRYCGTEGVPLTVDHCKTWESGGATVEMNLLSACKRCNRIRGNMPYENWLESPAYKSLSKDLSTENKDKNNQILASIAYLSTLKTVNRRSR